MQNTNEAYQKVTHTNMVDEFERKDLENKLVNCMEERERDLTMSCRWHQGKSPPSQRKH
jgi:hypothetical protein